MIDCISETNLASVLCVSNRTVESWINTKKIKVSIKKDNKNYFQLKELDIPEIKQMISSKWNSEKNIKPDRVYKSIELFAGAGGLALGLEKAGFSPVLLNEFDK